MSNSRTPKNPSRREVYQFVISVSVVVLASMCILFSSDTSARTWAFSAISAILDYWLKR